MPSYTKLFLFALLSYSALASPTKRQTRGKANEYRSGDCSGPINYSHVSADLESVTMDDTTHSVYLASPFSAWVAYEGKDRNGGKCTGAKLGVLPDLCNNLDTAFAGKRIRCVKWE